VVRYEWGPRVKWSPLVLPAPPPALELARCLVLLVALLPSVRPLVRSPALVLRLPQSNPSASARLPVRRRWRRD
jgi:hypothetical protein